MKKVKNADGSTNWFGDKNSLNWIQRTINTIGNGFNSALAKYTGTELTGAEREANEFSAEQAELAREHDIFMSQHKYQFETQSMADAGVNPALVYGGGNLVPTHATGAAPESVAPSSKGIGDLAQMFMSIARMPMELKNLKKQNELMESEAEKNKADAEKAEAEANVKNTEYQFALDSYEERLRNVGLKNQIDEETRDKIRQDKRTSLEQMNLFIKEQTTEEAKAAAEKAREVLQYMETYEIYILADVKKALYEAQTQKEKSIAALNGMQYMVQKKMLDSGYYDDIIATAEYHKLSAENRAKVDKIIADMRGGKVLKEVDLGDGAVADFFDSVINTYGTQPINGLVKIFSNVMQFMPFVSAGAAEISSAANYNPIGF